MPSYRVRFLKRVADSTGRERQICQRVVEVEAESSEAALEPARALFCSLEGIPHWSIRSEGCDLELIEPQAFGSRRAGRRRRSRSRPRPA